MGALPPDRLPPGGCAQERRHLSGDFRLAKQSVDGRIHRGPYRQDRRQDDESNVVAVPHAERPRPPYEHRRPGPHRGDRISRQQGRGVRHQDGEVHGIRPAGAHLSVPGEFRQERRNLGVDDAYRPGRTGQSEDRRHGAIPDALRHQHAHGVRRQLDDADDVLGRQQSRPPDREGRAARLSGAAGPAGPRLLQPFVLVVTALLAAAYAYPAARLATGPAGHIALAIPFFLIWIVPALYWTGQRDGEESWLDQAAHQASYLSMAWVSFILVLTLARDLLLFATAALPLERAHSMIAQAGIPAVFVASLVAVALGALIALRGPGVEKVVVPVAGLHADLEGLRIVQISDLHVGRSIRRGYVERVVERARALDPDLVALTGDMVDGPVARLAADVAPLAALARGAPTFFVLGNHDCYSGADAWIAHWREMGARVLLNEHAVLRKGAATLLVGGVVDPAYRALRPEISLEQAPRADFRLLLAHN